MLILHLEEKWTIMDFSRKVAVADPGGGQGGHGPPPSVPDKDYLLCTSWHFLVKKKLLIAK